MDAPAAPAAPDPVATANAQSNMNRQTATTQYELGATNQIAPQGTSSYKQIGTWEDGTPRFEQTTALNPGEQGIYDTGVQTRQNLGNIGQSQSAKIGALLNTPFDINASRDSKIGDIQKKFLDPQWAEAYDSKKTELFNSGVRPGTEAYDHAMRDFETNKQRGYDQSYLDSYNAANTAALTERNQPINEISALLSGSQVSQPSFGSTPAPGVAPTDYIGAQGQALAQQNVGYQGDLARVLGINQGLFSLGSAGAGGLGKAAAASDMRLKENIKRVGTADNGLPIYLFNYKGEDETQMGLMAQDVLHVHPEAVVTRPDGYMAVYYDRALEAV